MARDNIDTTNVITIPAAGYNLTDSADFKTMTLGADNGVEFTFKTTDTVVLKNDSGGDADYTVKTAPKDPHNTRGQNPVDLVITVATGKTWNFSPSETLHAYASTLLVKIDCDVAGKIVVLRRNVN